MQSYLWFGLLFGTMFSQVANGWKGGAILAGFSFTTSALVFFLIAANCDAIKRLKLLAGSLSLLALYYVAVGSAQYWIGSHSSKYVLWQRLNGGEDYGAALWIARLRALGPIEDPNDFAQFLAVCVAFLFFFYRPKKTVTNLLFVAAPLAYLLYGMFLTHSRGSVVALCFLLLFTLRRKMGSIGAAVVSGITGLGIIALGFTGGRAINAEEGADRLDAWGYGIQTFKQHPVFGVGYGSFTDHHVLTAHNSFVLCFTELGFLGYFCWIGMIVVGLMGVHWVITRNKPKPKPKETSLAAVAAGFSGMAQVSSPNGVAALGSEYSLANAAGGSVAIAEAATGISNYTAEMDTDSDQLQQSKREQELVNAARVIQSALIAYLTCAWFLSRAYVMLLYILLGMSASVVLIAMKQDPECSYVPTKKLFRFTLVAEVASISLVYILVRTGHVL